MNKSIYLDYAANTPVDEEVIKTFNETTLKYFANPNSTHGLGQEVKSKIDEATHKILKMLEENTNLSENNEIIYTSGSSESNNLAIKGVASAYRENGKHIITTFLEHSSVSSPLTYLKEQGYEIDLLNIDKNGKVDIEQLKSMLRKDTILVSICYVDSEVGIVQPIEEIAEILKGYPDCFLHVDATQAIGKTKLNFEGVDMICTTQILWIKRIRCISKKKRNSARPINKWWRKYYNIQKWNSSSWTNNSNGKSIRVSF